MGYGLSDRDRRRLEEGRKEAAEKMADERRRLDEAEARAAEAREHEARFGPITIAGPDGVPVMTWINRSGLVGEDALSMADNPVGCLIGLAIGLLVLPVSWVVHKLKFGGGYTLYASPKGHPTHEFREASQEAAVQRLQIVAEAIRSGGVSAWPPSPAS